MLSLCLDTSYRHLTVAIACDHQILAEVSYEAWQKQSEFAMQEVARVFEQAQCTPHDIQRIGVTIGPGSYTGIRIALTIAKVMATQLNIPLVVISSLQSLAGLNGEFHVLLDARGGRCFYGHYDNGVAVTPDQIAQLSDLPTDPSIHWVGDTYLIQRPTSAIDRVQNLVDLTLALLPVENIDAVVPQYLKEF